MDRRNGGDPLAPPRPPKLLPRVHRPRAPEPATMMNDAATTTATTTAVAATAADDRSTNATATATVTATPQCTNSNLQQQQHLSNINNNNNPSQQSQHHSITATAATTANLHSNNNHNSSNFSRSSTISNNNHNNNNAGAAVVATQPEFEDYQIHHLTLLPQRPSSLSRNSSHASASSITAANSFTRRRPPPLPSATTLTSGGAVPGAAVPLLTISANGSITSNSSAASSIVGTTFLSHFHGAEPAPASPVTLAQPRPESERLTNEYVDTPLRTAQQLQHASRAQHPAGQHDSGPTTTHHLLLLPQRELRLQQQHQQQQQQHQQHSHRLAAAAGSAIAAAGTDGTDGFLHSNNHLLHHPHNHSKAAAPAATSATTCPLTGKVTPPPPPRGSFAGTAAAQPITQPITKQPALAPAPASSNNCKFAKDVPAFDQLLDLHNIATGIATPQGMVSAVNGASPLGGGAQLVGGGGDPLNPIICPRCGRCRCEQCQSPRPLPQTWVCNKTCLCSAESVIDYASCLCCAKALFYHCARDNDMDCDDGSGTPCVDNPCSCGPYKRTQRWGWLGALSLVLPCLWFYWPMRGCVSLCERVYGRYAGHGCRCQEIGSTSSMLPIVQLGSNGGGMDGTGLGGPNGGQVGGAKSVGGGHHHHHHHNECSAASRILRKGDLTPEKRLLDSSPEY